MKLEILSKEDIQGLIDEITAIKEVIAKIDPSKPRKWVTESVAMEILDVSKSTIQKYRREGLIAFSQYQNKIHYKKVDLEAFLESNYSDQPYSINSKINAYGQR